MVGTEFWLQPGEISGADVTLLQALDFTASNEASESPVRIRADEQYGRSSSFLRTAGRFVLNLLSAEDVTTVPTELQEQRDRRIANAALHADFDAPSFDVPPVHRFEQWRTASSNTYHDSVTKHVQKKLAWDSRRDEVAPYGYYKDSSFHLIGRDSTVCGGVYVAPDGAALLVDHYSPQIQKSFQQIESIVRDLYDKNYGLSNGAVLWQVRDYVRAKLPYDGDRYDALVAPLLAKNNIIPVSELIDRKFATCEGQAAFGAALLEHLINRGLLHGRAAVERNFNYRLWVGHAYIAFDPAHNVDPSNVLVADMTGKEGFVGTRGSARRANTWWLFDVLRHKR